MAKVLFSGKAIRLESTSPLKKREEWRLWKKKGYRIPDKDGITIWEEKEGIRKIVLQAFEGSDCDLFLFGSRASGTAGDRSDYDVGYYTESPPSSSQMAALKDLLEELPIPARVELVDFQNVPEEFKKLALTKGNLEIWIKKKKNSLFM